MQYLRAMFGVLGAIRAEQPGLVGLRRADGGYVPCPCLGLGRTALSGFSRNTEVWSDGGNYARGHWLNGRASNRSLAGVVAEICVRAGMTDYTCWVLWLWCAVEGYAIGALESPRASIHYAVAPLRLRRRRA